MLAARFILAYTLVLAASACTKHEPRPPHPVHASDGELRAQVALDERAHDAGPDAELEPQRQEPAAGECFAAIDVLVTEHRGKDCASYEWKLKPASRRCVSACDDQARYDEAVQVGRDVCNALCLTRMCGPGAFTPRGTCETARCFPGIELCKQPQCPDWNSCYLFHTDAPWNCSCPNL